MSITSAATANPHYFDPLPPHPVPMSFNLGGVEAWWLPSGKRVAHDLLVAGSVAVLTERVLAAVRRPPLTLCGVCGCALLPTDEDGCPGCRSGVLPPT